MTKIIKITLIIYLLICTFNSYSQINLVNQNATKETIALKHFLDSIYGKKIISGQMDDKYLAYIQEVTGGKSPAIMGYDFNGICPSQSGNTDADKAIKWVKEQGGIAQFQWHWISPNADGDFYSDKYKLAEALADTNSSSYKNLVRDMDLVAGALKKLQDANVPVLWRPLHEAEGKWFWWGMAGGDACKKLWNIMYNRFTNYHHLNNLIWVWNSYGTTKENWYPGDNTVDIIAWDYPDYSASGSWSQYQNLFGGKGKLFGIGEDGKLTDPEILSAQPWLYFLTWSYMIQDPSVKDGKNTKDWLSKVYNDPRVLTLDDLSPGPKAYIKTNTYLFDSDGDSLEVVNLDGSASYMPNGTITAYEWTWNNQVISTSATASVQLPLGVHQIGLMVTSNTNETKTALVRVTVVKPNLAYKKAVSVSSTETGFGNTPENGVDGIPSTRWSSNYSDNQWYQIDLGKVYAIHTVVIRWENASAKSYRIDESNDGQNWTPVAVKQNMATGARTDSIVNMKGGSRYIRFLGFSRNTQYGYSFYEFEVWGTENPNAQPNVEITGIKNFDKESISLYPSVIKSDSNFYLNSGTYLKSINVQIFDMQGRALYNENHSGNTIAIKLNKKFVPGKYIVKIGMDNSLVTKCFIVE